MRESYEHPAIRAPFNHLSAAPGGATLEVGRIRLTAVRPDGRLGASGDGYEGGTVAWPEHYAGMMAIS